MSSVEPHPAHEVAETAANVAQQTILPTNAADATLRDTDLLQPAAPHIAILPNNPALEPLDAHPGEPGDKMVVQQEHQLAATGGQEIVQPSQKASLVEQHAGSRAQKEDHQSSEQDAVADEHSYPDSAVENMTSDGSDHGDAGQDADTDTFSDYASEDSASFYSSLLSFATDYVWENGRRYHAHQGGRYPLPNDETELDREDMKHHEWMLITDFRLHLAPIGNTPQKILDIGTGTGIWAMQIAEIYPSAEVIGTDISPVQPKWVPPNLTFEVDDLEQEWLYRPGSYDLINVRFMFLAVKDFPALLAQAYKTLKPGGYVELTELHTLPKVTNPNSPPPLQIFRWLDLFNEAMEKLGMKMRIAPTFKDLVINAGFVDVVETKFDVPWGAWPRDKRQKAIGFWHLEQLKQGLQGIVMKLFTRSFGWTSNEVEVFLVALRKELDDKSYQLLDHAYVVYGRKP